MARALIGGLLRQGVSARQLCVGEPQAAARAQLEREFGVRTTADNRDGNRRRIGGGIGREATADRAGPARAAGRADGTAAAACCRLWPACASLIWRGYVPPSMPIVRAMPNRPALLGAGITALYATPTVTAAQRSQAEAIARAAGRVVWLRAESELDVVTALSGSGPAYFFLLAEQLAQAAVALGLDPQTASVLAAETLLRQRGVVARRGHAGRAARRRHFQGRHDRGGAAGAPAGGFGPLVESALRAGAQRSAALADLAAAAVSSCDRTWLMRVYRWPP